MSAKLALLATLIPGLVVARVNFRGSGQLGQAQVELLLSEELADKDHHLKRYEDGMQQMFGALPKNEHGNLGHDALRSALYRFFVNRHGWYLHGLEPGIVARNYVDPEYNITFQDKDRLPVLLQDNFERRTGGRGATLHDAAAIAAVVEDLIRKETAAHLTDAYTATGIAQADTQPYKSAYWVAKVYFMSFLLEHNWTIENRQDLSDKEHIFEAKYPLYKEAMTWLNQTVDSEFGKDEKAEITAATITKVATKVGEEYHILNDGECADLRKQLQQMESRVPGRMRLSVFYNASLHSHWKFNEKVDTLRALGTLDESDPKQLYVIISNYATSKPNCVNASNVFDICCRNTCEDIMTKLESGVGSSAAPSRISELVSKISSDSVKAPRTLPATLLQRLEEVASHHGGQVPLHGRLFAQWLHHAYPLECSYPHEAGVKNLHIWTGGDGDSASEEEMKQHVDADACSINWEGKIDCGEEAKELPWSTTEELLQSAHVTSSESRSTRATATGSSIWFRLVVGVLGLALAALAAMPQSPFGRAIDLQVECALRSASVQRWHAVVAVLVLTAFLAGLLDPMVLAIATLGGVLAKFVVPKMGGDDSFKLPSNVKAV